MVHTDFFRDTKIRYLGYANEIGEALRPIIDRKYVRYSYGIAFGYVLADVVDKAVSKLSSDGRPTKVLWATGDALIWQGLASIVIPGMVINRIINFSEDALAKYGGHPYLHKIPSVHRARLPIYAGLASIPIIVYPIDMIVHFSGKAVEKRAPQSSILPKIPKNRRVFIPVCIGFASIPVIIHPIDLLVHAVMDLTYRKMHDGAAE
ncbi:mitochondrial 18 KDa protein (MTP18) domain-containing protein [Phthorimaea operculella]|nr:mitochondrial 18 KDa protein (MTP18) domain-containing protein [Phthorimaea operculella]